MIEINGFTVRYEAAHRRPQQEQEHCERMDDADPAYLRHGDIVGMLAPV
jgi:hypothetical protein